MAVVGAHLTETQLNKPSIFELVAADSLNQTFYPAIKRVFNYFTSKYPNELGWITTYYDEIYVVLNGTLQNYYLKYYNGSLSEVFYGISRYSTKNGKFNQSDYFKSMLILVALPYVKIKLEQWIEKYPKHNYLPALNRIYESFKLIQYILYLSNKSLSHTPCLKLFQLGLQYRQDDSNEATWTFYDVLSGSIKISHVLSSMLFRGLELSAFFLQFIQWWETESTQKASLDLPVPNPPNSSIDAIRYMGLCPLCLQKWIMPTAISISGYVYCYKCIMNHFENNGKTCPVTLYPADIDDLIRIYDDK